MAVPTAVQGAAGGPYAPLLIAGGQFVSTAVFGRSARKSAKRTASEERKLLRLQQEEQRLRNQILSASVEEQNAQLPFSASAPSRNRTRSERIPNTSNQLPDNAHAPKTTAKTETVAAGISPVLGIGLLASLFFLFR